METETLEAALPKDSNSKSVEEPWDPGIRAREWIGVLLVVTLAVLPDLNNAIASYQWVKSGASLPPMAFADLMYYIIGQSIFVCCITLTAILFLGRQWKATGIKPIRLRDIGWGLGIYLGGMTTYTTVCYLIPDQWFFTPQITDVLPAPADNEYMLLLAGSIANGMGEELVVRGYLISRLEALLGSTKVAVVLATAMFASYHIYQGWESMIGIFFLGLIYAYAFVRLRSIWAVFIAHALADFFGFLAL